MPKDCKICGASKYTEPKNGFVTCVYCHTKYSLAEIDEAPNDELNTINLVERYSKSVCEIHTVSMIDGNSIGSNINDKHTYGFLPRNTKIDIYVLAKFDNSNYGQFTINEYVKGSCKLIVVRIFSPF